MGSHHYANYISYPKMTTTTLFLILVTAVSILCIWLNNISSRIGIPTLLAFILLGIVFGNNGIWPVRFDNYNFAKETCTVALIFIMFYGGFGTRWEAVKPIVREAGLLASLGVIMTAGLTGLFCHFALGWGWEESLLLGAVVSSTDAASVFSVLRSKRLGLKNNTAPLLEVESGSNDPCAYMMTAIMLSVMNGTASGGKVAWMLFAQILFGAGCGVGIAKLAVHQRFDVLYGGHNVVVQQLHNLLLSHLVVLVTYVGGDGEAWRNGHTNVVHFSQVGTLASQLFTHLCVTFGLSVTEGVNSLLTHV